MDVNPRAAATAIVLACGALMWATAALAHAFPEREEPGVGAVVRETPKQVRIWFNAKLEPVFSTVFVEDADGKRISGASRVDPDSLDMVEAPLQPLDAGKYHVYWKVVARDGHRTEGDYTFAVGP